MPSDEESTQPFSSATKDRIAQQSTQPFSSATRGRISQQSTQPFSSVTNDRIAQDLDVRVRVNRQESGVARSRNAALAITPADLEVDQLTAAFTDISLASVPDARLVIAHPPWTGLQNPAVIRLPQSVGGWDVVGVVQRTHDVRLIIDLPYHDPPTRASNPRLVPMRLQCSVYYDPIDDDCVLVNYSGSDLYLSDLGPGGGRTCVASMNSVVIAPGIWRISVDGQAMSEIHLLDFLVLRRQFVVSIHETADRHSSSNKRQNTGLQPTSVKRRRQDLDTTEILVAPVAESARQLSTRVNISSKMPSQEIISTNQRSLLDLQDGDIAVVSSMEAEESQLNIHGSSRGPRDYEIRRLERIAQTASASVFTVQHSALPKDVVAKVMKYGATIAATKTEVLKDEEPKETKLIRLARSWEREKSFLERLNHVSITPNPASNQFT